jgi:hypothetical protein
MQADRTYTERERAMVVDMLCAAQGEGFRSFYEGDNSYGVAAVERSLRVLDEYNGTPARCSKCSAPIEADNESTDECFACQGAPEL